MELTEEILHNNIFAIQIDQFSLVYIKALKWMQTYEVKSKKADIPVINRLQCGIKTAATLSLQNLITLILYTDEGELCTKFSSTFRRQRSYESIKTIKKRNGGYWHWSKILKETVQCFGTDKY